MGARAEVYSREDPQDILSLQEDTLDPNKHYRFCHPRNLARRKSQGYEVVLRSETGVRLLNEDEHVTTADDLIRVGDLVLMMCDKKRFNQRRQQTAKLAHDRLASSERSFEARARKRGVRSLTGDEGG